MDPLLQEFLGIAGNEYPTTKKTDDEIKRLTLEEDMPEVKRAAHILYRGQSIQKPSVYLNLCKILLEPEAFSKIIPHILLYKLSQDGILSQNPEVQIEAGRSLMKLMSTQQLDESQLIDILNVTLTVLTLWNQSVLDEWVLVFHEVIKRVPYSAISGICEPRIVNLSDSSQHPLSKYIAARMIGLIAEQGIKPVEPLYDRARFLCQDSEIEVRRVMASEVILKICRHVGNNLTENKYIEKVMELSYDSNLSVKLAAIDSLVESLDLLSFGFKKTRMAQVLIELMNSVNEEVMKKMSFLVGKILYKLDKIIWENPAVMLQIQNIIKEWVAHKSIEIKRNLIYNSPYLLRIFENKEFFKDLYLKATKDSVFEMRLTAMSCFHQVLKAFDIKESQTIFREAFQGIFQEENIQILEKIVPHLNEIVCIFQPLTESESAEETMREREELAKKSREHRAKELKEWKEYKDSETDLSKSEKSTKASSKESLDQKSCLEDLISIGNYLNLKHAWRLEVTFIETMNKCFDFFELKELADVYVDFLMKEMGKGVKEVRRSAIESLIIFIKRNHHSSKTNDIMKKVVEEFHTGTTFQKRLAFLEFYEQCGEHFSRQFFKTYNLNELALALGQDKVVEIRKKFLDSVITFRKMVKKEDKPLLAQLDEVINKNISDKNRFISQLASQAAKEIRSLTSYFFEEFNKEEAERLKREEALKEKEKEELESIKRRQHEELLKGRADHFNVLTSLLFGGKKTGKKYLWNDVYTAKFTKTGPASAVCLNETPKNKYCTPLVSLPLLKTQKTVVLTGNSSQLSSKESENKPKYHKPRISKTLIIPDESGTSKKKAGSFSASSKEKVLGFGSNRGPTMERKSSKERNMVTEPTSREVSDIRIGKLNLGRDIIDRGDKDRVKIPTIRKKFS